MSNLFAPDPSISVRRATYAACAIEVLSKKAGNVHPTAAFSDAVAGDFLRSAEILAEILGNSSPSGQFESRQLESGQLESGQLESGQPEIGRTILAAVEATRRGVGHNTNLGIVLLLTPLAAVGDSEPWQTGVELVLSATSLDDARLVFQAIRTAKPGGLGSADRDDVTQQPSQPLVPIMATAAARDSIAREYATNFAATLDRYVPFLAERKTAFEANWERTVIDLQLEILSRQPDSLIARKCGDAIASEAMRRARDVVQAGGTSSPTGLTALHEFDVWLRSDGNRRNPGTTADLIAAALFVAFRSRILEIPDIAAALSAVNEQH